MAIDRKAGQRVIKRVRTEDATGIRMDAGPFIGIVKHVLDPTHSGRLQVYLPHLGGDPNNANNQKIVQYASPFSGHTSFQQNPNGDTNTKLGFETVRHSYGMWFTPPDIGTRVLVIFEASNANNGYWIACLPPVVEHNQIGSSGGVASSNLSSDPQVDSLISGYGAAFAPGVDYNSADLASIVSPHAISLPKPPHRIQTKILAEQGLLADPKRGIDNATSVRETPTAIFGITTPGRTYVDQATDDLLRQVSANPNVDTSKIREKVTQGRKGGHQFIMDDGDFNGNQRRLKLRSAAGHQIILDDTDGMIYISNATGTNWIELTNDGQILIYAASDISLRTGGNLNVKVDGDYNTEVNGDYNVKVRGNMKTEVDANREEIVAGNKDIDVQGRYHQTVTDSIRVEGKSNYSLTVANDIAVQSSANIGIKASTELNIDAGANIGINSGAELTLNSADVSGWECGDSLFFQGVEIGLNSSPPNPLAAPVSVQAPTVPQQFTLADLNDTVKNGDIWQHNAASASTSQTILPKITTHEPYDSRDITQLISTTGTPSKRI